MSDNGWTTRFTAVPPARLRTVCCKYVDDTPPPPDQMFLLDLDNFLMSCPKCGRITPWEAVPDDA